MKRIFSIFFLISFSVVAIAQMLQFNANGKFKIVQFTDTHYIYQDKRSEVTIERIKEVMEAENPDFVILTGDVIYGEPAEESYRTVLDLISGEKLLLFVDNLETAIDKDIIEFINYLPEPVKALTTSRRNVITVSSFPIEIGSLTNEEIVRYITSLSALSKFSYCNSLSDLEKEKIGNVFNGIPLAIKWIISSCKNSEELLTKAASMESGGIQNEELLEFCFRRVFDEMSSIEKGVMRILAVISDLPIEAIVQAYGSNSKSAEIIDALETLVSDTIIIRYYDADARSDKYRLL